MGFREKLEPAWNMKKLVRPWRTIFELLDFTYAGVRLSKGIRNLRFPLNTQVWGIQYLSDSVSQFAPLFRMFQ